MHELGHSAFRISPLTGSIGARVTGMEIDDASDKVIEFLTAALDEYGVLFLPEQKADLDDFVRLGRAFGEVQPAHPIKPGIDGYPELLGNQTGNVTSDDALPRDIHNRQGGNWHIDGTFVKDVPVYSMLFARTVPDRGGDTLFADLAGAYEALSEPFRHLVDRLVCDHDARRLYPEFLDPGADPELRSRMAATSLVTQPLVHVAPRTGRRSLVLNPNCTTKIHGMSQLESDTLIGLLTAYALVPERTVRWKWSVGDVVIWDNRRLLHNYLFDHGARERFIVRLIVGAEPFSAPR